MLSAHVASTDQRSEVHTEVRTPIEMVLSRIVMFIFGFIEVVIALRFVLKLFGANTEAAFVQLVYGVSTVFMRPFEAVFQTQTVEGATFEWSALVAIAVYALIAWGIVAFIGAVSPRERAETVETVRRDDASKAP
jgi:hypothetical protein